MKRTRAEAIKACEKAILEAYTANTQAEIGRLKMEAWKQLARDIRQIEGKDKC